MKLRAVNGGVREAEITTEHPAASYECPLVMVDGEPVGPIEADLCGYEYLDTTDDERAALVRGGYALR